MNIVIWDLNEPAMQAVAKELRAKGAGVWTYRVDVSKRERVYEVAKQVGVGCTCVSCLWAVRCRIRWPVSGGKANNDCPCNRTTRRHMQMKRDVKADVTVLVQNAGIVSGKPFLDGEDAYSLRTMEVNAMAHFWTIKVGGWVRA